MIQDIIEEIRKVNEMIDLHCNNGIDITLSQYKSIRDRLIFELEKEIEKLKDFENWKEWKNQ
jgi:hypothetical protein